MTEFIWPCRNFKDANRPTRGCLNGDPLTLLWLLCVLLYVYAGMFRAIGRLLDWLNEEVPQ